MTNNPTDDQLPKYTWWALGLTAVLLLALTVTAIGFISAGFFDPKPIGDYSISSARNPTLSVDANSQSIQWPYLPIPTADDHTVRLTAAYQSGDLNSAYGLALEDDDIVWIIAISPLGYVTIQELDQPFNSIFVGDDLDNMIANGPENGLAVSDTAVLEWQIWPHINPDMESNEIWIDKRGGTFTVYVNREFLWSGPLPITTPRFGYYVSAFEGSAVIDFKSLEFFSETPISIPAR